MTEVEQPVDQQALSEADTTRPKTWAWFDEPPSWLFHGVLGCTLVFLMWAASPPGWVFMGWFLGLPFLGLLGIVWIMRRVAFALARRKPRAVGDQRVFLIAPCMVLLFVGLVAVGAPLRVRWLMSRPSFEQVVSDAPAATDDQWKDLGGPQRVGLYNVTAIYQVRDAVIFYESSGGFIDDTGFACLPSGPFPELENGGFESPQFDHLGGCWYTWTASW